MKIKPKAQLITGVDIGSSAIRVAVGQQMADEGGRPRLQILGAIEVVSDGIHKGLVASIEDAVSSISGALEQVERMVGIPIENAWVGMSGIDILSQANKGVVAVSKPDGEIASEDVDRVVEAAKSIAPPLNYETLHTIARGYCVDGQFGIKDPVGMTGIRLEVDAQLIHGLSNHLNSFSKAVHRTGIGIDDLVLSIISTGHVVTTAKQRELGTVVVDIGAAVTNFVVYQDGDIVHVATVPVGSGHVTNDLAIGLKTSIDVAERVKIYCGHCVADFVTKKEKIDLIKLGAEKSEVIDRKLVAEIVEARMSELLEKINDELSRVESINMLPAGVVFTGGGAKIDGIIDLAKEVLSLPASLGYPLDIISSTDKINDLSFAPAIGLVKWGAGLSSGHVRHINQTLNIVNKVADRTKDFLRSLIP